MFIEYSLIEGRENENLFVADLYLSARNIPVRAFEMELCFDIDLLKVHELHTHEIFIEKNFYCNYIINNDKGHIQVSCGSRVPFCTSSDDIAFVRVLCSNRSNETARLHFGSKTRLLLHDGFQKSAILSISENKFVLKESACV